MLKQVLNRLQGQVRLRVDCAFPERILNLCGARNLAFWDLDWASETAFTCRLSRRDFHTLRRAAKNLDCTLTVVRREGAPYFLRRFRRRYVLLSGLVLCGALLFFGSFFIWDFTVEGNETVPREEILRSLQKNGITLGTFGFAVDAEDLRNHVLLDIPRLSWMTVNVSGCRAYVQVRERVAAPTLVDRRTPTNVVARRAGLVREVIALEGVTMVLPGTTVEAGQILISGVEDTDTFGARILAARGEVTARTWYRLSCRVPLTVPQKIYTGEEKTCRALVLGTQRIKFFSNSSIEGANYDKITKRTHWSLFGLALPVTTVEETLRFYDCIPSARSPAVAEKTGEAVLTEYLGHLVRDYGTVRSTLCTSKRQGSALTVTVTAECLERIGKPVPLYAETEGGG
ncbi:MAG: sporulation protein YqfD [Oscillibacter sp.]